MFALQILRRDDEIKIDAGKQGCVNVNWIEVLQDTN
jgi:hypothetical protein